MSYENEFLKNSRKKGSWDGRKPTKSQELQVMVSQRQAFESVILDQKKCMQSVTKAMEKTDQTAGEINNSFPKSPKLF